MGVEVNTHSYNRLCEYYRDVHLEYQAHQEELESKQFPFTFASPVLSNFAHYHMTREDEMELHARHNIGNRTIFAGNVVLLFLIEKTNSNSVFPVERGDLFMMQLNGIDDSFIVVCKQGHYTNGSLFNLVNTSFDVTYVCNSHYTPHFLSCGNSPSCSHTFSFSIPHEGHSERNNVVMLGFGMVLSHEQDWPEGGQVEKDGYCRFTQYIEMPGVYMATIAPRGEVMHRMFTGRCCHSDYHVFALDRPSENMVQKTGEIVNVCDFATDAPVRYCLDCAEIEHISVIPKTTVRRTCVYNLEVPLVLQKIEIYNSFNKEEHRKSDVQSQEYCLSTCDRINEAFAYGEIKWISTHHHPDTKAFEYMPHTDEGENEHHAVFQVRFVDNDPEGGSVPEAFMQASAALAKYHAAMMPAPGHLLDIPEEVGKDLDENAWIEGPCGEKVRLYVDLVKRYGQAVLYYVLNSRDHLQDLPLCYDRHLIKYLSDKLEKLSISFLNVVPPNSRKRVSVQNYQRSSGDSHASDAAVPADGKSPKEHCRFHHQGFVHVPWQGVLATRPIRPDDVIYQSCRIHGQQGPAEEKRAVPSWTAEFPKRPKWEAGYPDSEFDIALSNMSLPDYDVAGNPLPVCSETGAVVRVHKVPSRPRSWSGRDPLQLPVSSGSVGSFYSRDLSFAQVIKPSRPWRSTTETRKPLFQGDVRKQNQNQSDLGKGRSAELQTAGSLLQGDLHPKVSLHGGVSHKVGSEKLRDGRTRIGGVKGKGPSARGTEVADEFKDQSRLLLPVLRKPQQLDAHKDDASLPGGGQQTHTGSGLSRRGPTASDSPQVGKQPCRSSVSSPPRSHCKTPALLSADRRSASVFAQTRAPPSVPGLPFDVLEQCRLGYTVGKFGFTRRLQSIPPGGSSSGGAQPSRRLGKNGRSHVGSLPLLSPGSRTADVQLLYSNIQFPGLRPDLPAPHPRVRDTLPRVHGGVSTHYKGTTGFFPEPEETDSECDLFGPELCGMDVGHSVGPRSSHEPPGPDRSHPQPPRSESAATGKSGDQTLGHKDVPKAGPGEQIHGGRKETFRTPLAPGPRARQTYVRSAESRDRSERARPRSSRNSEGPSRKVCETTSRSRSLTSAESVVAEADSRLGKRTVRLPIRFKPRLSSPPPGGRRRVDAGRKNPVGQRSQLHSVARPGSREDAAKLPDLWQSGTSSSPDQSNSNPRTFHYHPSPTGGERSRRSRAKSRANVRGGEESLRGPGRGTDRSAEITRKEPEIPGRDVREPKRISDSREIGNPQAQDRREAAGTGCDEHQNQRSHRATVRDTPGPLVNRGVGRTVPVLPQSKDTPHQKEISDEPPKADDTHPGDGRCSIRKTLRHCRDEKRRLQQGDVVQDGDGRKISNANDLGSQERNASPHRLPSEQALLLLSTICAEFGQRPARSAEETSPSEVVHEKSPPRRTPSPTPRLPGGISGKGLPCEPLVSGTLRALSQFKRKICLSSPEEKSRRYGSIDVFPYAKGKGRERLVGRPHEEDNGSTKEAGIGANRTEKQRVPVEESPHQQDDAEALAKLQRLRRYRRRSVSIPFRRPTDLVHRSNPFHFVRADRELADARNATYREKYLDDGFKERPEKEIETVQVPDPKSACKTVFFEWEGPGSLCVGEGEPGTHCSCMRDQSQT